MPAQNPAPSAPSPPEAAFSGMPKKITALLEKESDRGAILILGAYLEEILALIVRASATSDKTGEALLEFRSPAGDFSSKITLCDAFGLISPDEAKALNALRKIRNSAAHFDQKGRGFDVLFDSPETVAQVKSFAKHLNIEVATREPKVLRTVFILGGRLLATKLYIRLCSTTRHPVQASNKELANVARANLKGTPFGEAFAKAEKLAQEGNLEELLSLGQSLAEYMQERIAEELKSASTKTDT